MADVFYAKEWSRYKTWLQLNSCYLSVLLVSINNIM